MTSSSLSEHFSKSFLSRSDIPMCTSTSVLKAVICLQMSDFHLDTTTISTTMLGSAVAIPWIREFAVAGSIPSKMIPHQTKTLIELFQKVGLLVVFAFCMQFSVMFSQFATTSKPEDHMRFDSEETGLEKC